MFVNKRSFQKYESRSTQKKGNILNADLNSCFLMFFSSFFFLQRKLVCRSENLTILCHQTCIHEKQRI